MGEAGVGQADFKGYFCKFLEIEGFVDFAEASAADEVGGQIPVFEQRPVLLRHLTTLLLYPQFELLCVF